MFRRVKPLIKFAIGWPLTVIALIFIIKFILPNASEVAVSIRRINVALLLFGIVSFILYFLIRSYFWYQLLVQRKHTVGLKETIWKWGIAELRRYIPGNIWSLVGRSANFSENKIKTKEIVSYAIIEAEFIVIGCVVLSLLSLNFVVYGMLPQFAYKPLIVTLIAVLTICFAIAFLANRFVLNLKLRYPSRSADHPSQEGIWNFIPSMGGVRGNGGWVRALAKALLPSFPFQTNLKLFCIETLALFFFGLGTYFSISSLTLLYVHDIATFIGFFVFSLLVGYVSFITPMGLGVREGIMTAGLAKFIPLALAGFASIFTRIVFIISELLFLLLIYIWYQSKNTYVIKLEKYIRAHWHMILLCVFIGLYILYMTTVSFLRYDNFYTGRFDLGNMDQTVWNTIHGRAFQQTDPNGTNIISRLAFHADFILVLLAPFYLLWQDPKMLLLIQTVILALGALFVYVIANRVIHNKSYSLLFGCIYLINPSINYTNLYDFHGVTLATTFLLAAFYFLQERKRLLTVLFLVLAGLTKEEVWLITALFGIYTMITVKETPSSRSILFQRGLGFSITLLSLVIFYYLVEIAIPDTRGGAHFALAYYSDFGASPSEIIKTLIFNPEKTLGTILQPGPLSYVFEIFAPLGFISLFSPLYLVFALPDLAGDMLSNNPALHQIYYQYTASITPFIFIAGIYGFQWLVARSTNLRRSVMVTKPVSFSGNVSRQTPHDTGIVTDKRFTSVWKKFINQKLLVVYLVVASLISAYYIGPLPGSQNANVTMIDSPQPYANVINDFLTDIPKRYSIAATNNLGSHLSHRQKIFTIPVGIDKADIIAFLLNDPFAQPSLDAQKKMAENMKKDKNYIEVFKQGDFVVFEKRDLYVQKEPNITHVRLFPLSIPALQHRDYEGGEIQVEKTIDTKKFATLYEVSYPSDGLKLFADMEIPNSSMLTSGFPVIILNTVSTPETLMDYYAAHGYLVIKPDYRGIGNSEVDNPSLAPLAYSVDMLNLLTSLSTIHEANTHQIFLWGEGIGGNAVLKALEIAGDNPDTTFLNEIRGVILWAPITSPYEDENMYNDLAKKFGSQQENPVFWQSISPLNYIDDIKTPLEIDHGTADTLVPYTSSIELYDDLVSFNKNAKLNLYPNDDHELSKYRRQVLKENLDFFQNLTSKA